MIRQCDANLNNRHRDMSYRQYRPHDQHCHEAEWGDPKRPSAKLCGEQANRDHGENVIKPGQWDACIPSVRP